MKSSLGLVTAGIAQGGVALLVAVGNRLGVVCAGAAMDAGLRSVNVARVDEALERIAIVKPRVVVVPAGLLRTEVVELAETARAHGGELVELPAVVEPRGCAHAIAAAVARTTFEDGPHTQRSSEIRLKGG